MCIVIGLIVCVVIPLVCVIGAICSDTDTAKKNGLVADDKEV